MNKIFIFIPSEGQKYFKYYYKQIEHFFSQKKFKKLNLSPHTLNKNESKNYKKYISSLSQADFVIIESSLPNIETGYFISKALELNKPVISLYLKDHLSNFLKRIKEEKFNLIEYTENNIEKKLEAACEKAKKSADKRFNFFVSSNQLNYLNQEAKKARITKSAFIRRLISDYSKKEDPSN